MRVLAVAAWLPTKEEPHLGAFIVEHMLAASRACSVDVVQFEVSRSLFGPRFAVSTERITRNCAIHRIKLRLFVRRFGIFEKKLESAMNKLVIRLTTNDADFDVVHVNVSDQNTRIAINTARTFDLPVVYSEHWSFYHRGFKALPEEEKSQVKSEINKWLNNPRLKYIFPVSQDLAGHLTANFGAPLERIVVIPNVANDLFHFIPGIRGSKNFRIVLVAAWTAPKNPVLFTKALQSLPSDVLDKIRIDWIGDGPQLESCKNMLTKKCKNLDIHFHGFRDKNFVAEKLQKADLMVHPTDAENLPTVIIESLCCGTPVLSHNVNGIPELLNRNNGIMCNVGNVEEFARRLEQLVRGEFKYDHEKIASDAQKLFSAEAVGGVLNEYYRKAIQR